MCLAWRSQICSNDMWDTKIVRKFTILKKNNSFQFAWFIFDFVLVLKIDCMNKQASLN